MKSLLLSILMLFAPIALSAGVTLDLDTGMSIDEIRYENNENPCAEGWESGWVTLDLTESSLRSYRCKLIPFSGKLETVSDNTKSTMDVIYQDQYQLHQISVNNNGDVTSQTYPSTGNAISGHVYLDETAYVLDGISNTVWRWNEFVETELVFDDEMNVEVEVVSVTWDWLDVSEEVDLPAGQLSNISSIYSYPIISVNDGDDKGVWGLNNQTKLSERPLQDAEITPSSFGYIQLVIDTDGVYKIYWMGTNKSLETLNVDSEQVTHEKTISTETGVLFTFLGSDGQAVFVWRDSESARTISQPSGVEKYYGCYPSYPKAFCLFSNIDGDLVIYEAIEDGFRADTAITLVNIPASISIEGMAAIGDKRYLAVNYNDGTYDFHAVLMMTPDRHEVIFRMQLDQDSEYFSMNVDHTGGTVNWIGLFQSDIFINKLDHSGSTTFIENTVGGLDQDGRNGEDEKVFPRAEIAGHFSLGILCLMILLLLRRRPLI